MDRSTGGTLELLFGLRVDRHRRRGLHRNAVRDELQGQVVGGNAGVGIGPPGRMSEAIAAEDGRRERGLNDAAIDQKTPEVLDLRGRIAATHFDVDECLEMIAHADRTYPIRT